MSQETVDHIVVDDTWASPEIAESVQEWFSRNPISDARLAFSVRIPTEDERELLTRER